jgi:peptidyl-prolyl cis-trans isomerase C
MKRLWICPAIALIFTLSVIGCKKDSEKEPSPSAQAVSSEDLESIQSSALPGLEAVDKDAMMASVNGKVITRADVDDETDTIMMQFQGRIPPQQMGTMRSRIQKQALENLINTELLLQEADRKDIEPQEQKIEEKIGEISGRFPTKEDFENQLASAGISEQELRDEIEEGMKIEAVLEAPISGAEQVTDKEVKDYYGNNPDRFQKQEQVQASHILIKFDPEDGPAEKDEKFKKLAGIKKEIENGADFAGLAKEHSDCPSKSKGGDLGYFGRGQMVKPFEDAAFSMKKGELSDIVETRFGYHLIKVTDRTEGGAVPLSEAREDIELFLNNQKRQQAVNEYLNELRQGAEIKYAETESPPPDPMIPE